LQSLKSSIADDLSVLSAVAWPEAVNGN